MVTHYKKLIDELNKNLHFLSLEQDSVTKLCEESVKLCNRALDQCKRIVREKGFKTKEEEIHFFKSVKPQIASKLKYNLLVFKTEHNKPLSENAQKNYYEKCLTEIDVYFRENTEFMTYYKTGSTYMDSNYFVRNNADLNLLADDCYFLGDKNFCTTHDTKIAQIIAYELLAVYIRNNLQLLEKREGMEPIKSYRNTLVWTDSKVFLVELIYALHTAGSFNRGTLELKELALTISEICNIDLGDFYRTWAEIKLRKEPTKFLDTLKVLLEKRINEDLK
jgi:hypothetical protein